MRRLTRGQMAVLASFFIHGAVFAAAGALWHWDVERSRQPIYVEVTMAELLAPIEGAAGGGALPGETPKPEKPFPMPRPESAFSETTESRTPAPSAVSAMVSGGSATGGGATSGSGGAAGVGGGTGRGSGPGLGSGTGTGSGPTRGPRIVDGAKPDYPENARTKGWEGVVKLQILVNTDGRVEDVRMVAGSGYAELDQAAQAAVRTWRFSPALQKGLPVAAWATLPVVFDLR